MAFDETTSLFYMKPAAVIEDGRPEGAPSALVDVGQRQIDGQRHLRLWIRCGLTPAQKIGHPVRELQDDGEGHGQAS